MTDLDTKPTVVPFSQPAGRTEWKASLARYNKATTAAAEFDPEYDRIEAVWRDGLPSMDSIHWSAFPFADRGHVARILNLEAAEQHHRRGLGKWWWAKDAAASLAKFRAALDSVQQFRDAEERHEIESGFRAASDHYERLTDAICDASDELMAMAAPDAAALRWKLEHLKNDDGSFAAYEPEYLHQVNEDIARILGPAG
jgi:hypothetical protein